MSTPSIGFAPVPTRRFTTRTVRSQRKLFGMSHAGLTKSPPSHLGATQKPIAPGLPVGGAAPNPAPCENGWSKASSDTAVVDQHDADSELLGLWSPLEFLTGTQFESYDKTLSRVAKLPGLPFLRGSARIAADDQGGRRSQRLVRIPSSVDPAGLRRAGTPYLRTLSCAAIGRDYEICTIFTSARNDRGDL